MRKIYTSPRVENVDRVAQLFAEHGIAARVTNDGGWRGRDHRRFSYFGSDRQQSGWPQVWIIKAEDQPRARELLREIGIKPAVQFGEELDSERGNPSPVVARRRSVVTRVRLALLVIIGVIMVLSLIRTM
ncbi:MAG: hypothetical protein WCD66_06390 [Rhodanobacteraceae bacterium]